MLLYETRLAVDLVSHSRRQWTDRHRLEALQSRLLRAVIEHAYATVPIYRERFDRAKIAVGDVHSLADLADLPVLTRGELGEIELPRRVTSLVDPSQLPLGRTSGSSGRPLTIPRDPFSRRLNKAQFLRALGAAGYRLGDNMMLLTRGPRGNNPRWLRWRHVGREGPPKQHLAAWREMRPRFIYGFVTPLRRLALLVLEESPPRHRVRAVFTSGETLDRATRLLLREAFGGPVFDVYGATEVGTFAWECECHDGLHVGEDIILCEFIPLPGNPFSQLVITSLKNRVMPLIRYAIGDLAVAGPAQPCACGRTFHRIARLEGRLIDCIHRPDGELVTPYAIETAMENVPGIRRFQVIQEEPAAMTVRVQGDQDAAIVDRVRAALRPLMGPIARLQVAFAPSLDPPLGQKFRLIECRLPKPEAE